MSTLLQAVEAVARLGGNSALNAFKTSLAIETKADGSPVTTADREAEQLIRDYVSTHFPEDGVVGEELGQLRPNAKRTWYVDPIDGTKAFIRGVPLWGTLVAVVEGEDVLAGCIYIPALDELVVAAKGEGCFHNGQRVKVSDTATLAKATVLTTDVRAVPPAVERVLQRSAISRTWGDCFGYVLVATGRADVMIDPLMNPWDAAALKPIIEEAGGVFTDLSNRTTAFGGSVVATNRALSAEVRALLDAPKPPSLPATLTLTAPMTTVVTQHARTGEVLMVAYTDQEAVDRTLATGEMHYRSRTRGLWHKGATSGNVQKVESLHFDCDGDALLARVLPAGPACHTNDRTCFHDAPRAEPLGMLNAVIEARAAVSGTSYTQKLLANRNLRLKKIGEEATELVMALTERDATRSIEEAADVVYHLLVALRAEGLSLDDVRETLHSRHTTAEAKAQSNQGSGAT